MGATTKLTLTHYVGGKITGTTTDFATLSTNYPNLTTFMDFELLVEFILVSGAWEQIGDKPIPDFFDNFSSYQDQGEADTSWVSTDTAKNRVNISTKELDFALQNQTALNEAIAHDLGVGFMPSTTVWTLRGKIRFSNITPNGTWIYGISDGDQTENFVLNRQDMIALALDNTAGTINIFWDNGATFNAGSGTSFVFVTATNYYIELIRNGTSITGNVYSDAGFSSLIQTVTTTITGTIDNARYVKLTNSNGSGQTGNNDGTLDNVEIFLNTTTP